MSGLSLGTRVSNLKSVALSVLELLAFNSHDRPLRTQTHTHTHTHRTNALSPPFTGNKNTSERDSNQHPGTVPALVQRFYHCASGSAGSRSYRPSKRTLSHDYNCDSTAIRLRSDYDVSCAPGFIRREQKMNMPIFRRSRLVLISQSNRKKIVISITSVVVECVVVSSYRSRIVVESQL